MKFSFLGYSVQGIMEFDLDVKDIAILRYFDDFRKSGKMNSEVVDGEEYYWISYQGIERELPFLNLSKRSIMMRMHKLRDAGLLKHYTKKQGGTFSYYAFGKNYEKLIYLKDTNKDKDNNEEIENDKDNKDKENKNLKNNNLDNKEELEKDKSNNQTLKKEANFKEKILGLDNKSNEKVKGELAFEIDSESEILDSMDEFMNRGNQNKGEGLSLNKNRGCSEKGRTKIHLLNNSSTKKSNLLKDIAKDIVKDIIDYLNLKAGVIYKSSNFKTLSLIRERLSEGFTLDNFKTVIDKKVDGWKGTKFEEYLTPFTLFGDKFEVYLNQKIRREDNFEKLGNFEREPRKLRFDNFESREYDYDSLEKKLLGWE